MNNLGSKIIETKRLILKPVSMQEQKRSWEILMLENVRKYYLVIPKKFKDNLFDWEKQKKFYEKEVEHAHDLDVYKWSIFIKDTNTYIGKIMCQDNDELDKSIRDVGWYIDPDFQGKGYASEAAFAMMDYMFNEVEINKIITGAAEDNPASWKIMEKYGFIDLNKTTEVQYTFLDEPTNIKTYIKNR